MSDCHTPPVAPNGAVAPPPPELPPGTPAAKLVATLAFSGALAGLLIVLAFQWAYPNIVAYQAKVLAAAVDEVLSAPARTEPLYLYEGALRADLPAGVDSATVERVFVGYDPGGERVGFAILGGEPGFADVISLIFGYDPEGRRVLGMKVLNHKETPGLGDRIVNDSAFVARFRGPETPLLGVKPGAGKGAANEVDLITGATISSRAVIGIINRRLEVVAPLVDRYLQEGEQ